MSDIRAALRQARKGRELVTVILDIERMKGSASVEFWSLSDFKNRRIHADDVTEWPRTICAAWRTLGDRQTMFASEWTDGPEGLARATWEAYDAADIVVGHNLAGFDTKHLNTMWRDHGLMPPSPYKVIDTLQVARRTFGDESKTLDALAKRMRFAGKNDRYDVEVARKALAGHGPSQRKIERYNRGDLDPTEALYVTMLPWIKSHPHVAPDLANGVDVCPRCASKKIERNGTWAPAVHRYLVYRCTDCGGNFKTTIHAKGPSVMTL